MENKKIIFMGTPEIAAVILERLLNEGAEVSLVVTQPDRKKGRRNTLEASPVKQMAQAHGIPVFQPERIRKDFTPIVQEKAALIVTCAYGQIVPKEVLDAPVHGCVNLHGSLLPEYRGAAPIQRALWDGKKQSGMSLMRMEEGMDTGGVMDVEVIDILDEDTSTSLFEKMGLAAADLLMRNLNDLLAGNAQFAEQEEDKATYAAKISKEEEHIDLSRTDWQIFNQIRALADEPGGYLLANGRKLKILSAAYLPDEAETHVPGLLIKEGKKGLRLDLHQGQLDLQRVQLEGKAPMAARDFVNGAGRTLLGQVLV